MTRAPVRPARAPRAPAAARGDPTPTRSGPANPSRAAGAPAPASAAATAPRPVPPVYDPAPASPLASGLLQGDSPPAPASLAEVDFSEASAASSVHAGITAAQAVDTGHGTTVDIDNPLIEQGFDEEEESLEAAIARIRQYRKPIGSLSQKLALPPIPGYHQHWFNDDGARVEEAKLNGWAHVVDHHGKPRKYAVGSGRDKGIQFGYAMKIPLVFWQEDMAARHAAADATIQATKKQLAVTKPGEANASDKGKFYDPTESGSPITIRKG